MIPAYCDYCGEHIHNWHKVEYGQDIYQAVLNKTAREAKSFWDMFTIFIWAVYIRPGWIFCNKNHKDLFARKMGLKKVRR
jgi:hypothetical protein